MKKITFFAIISILAFTFACKKDSKITDIVNLEASMKCKINGTAWSAQSRLTSLQSNKFIINGTGSLGSDVISITTFGISTGTYNLSINVPVQTQFSATFTNSTSTDSLYTAYEGTVTLSTVDTVNKRISGTYSFKTKNLLHLLLSEKNITEGTFKDLSY
jgi:hypothetical protein